MKLIFLLRREQRKELQLVQVLELFEELKQGADLMLLTERLF